MQILPIHNTIMNSVTYVLYEEDVDYCVLVDCGEWETLKPVLERIGKRVKAVLLTHGHSDHIYGLNGLLKVEPSLVIGTNEEGHDELADARKNLSFYHGMPFTIEGYEPLVLHDGMTLHFDGLADIEVIATPGHSPSCLCYCIESSKGLNSSRSSKGDLFTGDAYIPGIKTFTKFPRGDKDWALKSIALLTDMEKQGYKIYCGHHSYDRE